MTPASLARKAVLYHNQWPVKIYIVPCAPRATSRWRGYAGGVEMRVTQGYVQPDRKCSFSYHTPVNTRTPRGEVIKPYRTKTIDVPRLDARAPREVSSVMWGSRCRVRTVHIVCGEARNQPCRAEPDGAEGARPAESRSGAAWPVVPRAQRPESRERERARCASLHSVGATGIAIALTPP